MGTTAASKSSGDCLPEPISCGYLHHDLDHPVSSFSVIGKMRDDDRFCDVRLRVGDSVWKAHRLVLASTSGYFYDTFNVADELELELADVDSSAVQLLVDFSYTSRVLITRDNVRHLLSASSFLRIESVRNACCTFLMENLCPANCLDTWRLAKKYSCDELAARSRVCALKDFKTVCDNEEFLRLSYRETNDLVSEVCAGEQVFVAVARWIKHDLAERSQYTARLLGNMQLAKMSRQFLLDVVYTEPLVRSDLECNNLLLNAFKHQLFPGAARSSGYVSNCTSAERWTADGMTPYVFAVGGMGSRLEYHKSGERYDPGNDRWLPIANMSQCRYHVAVASSGRLIYAVGGYDGREVLSSAEHYDPLENKWSTINGMGSKRRDLGVGAIDGLLYACGGDDGTSVLNTVERYDPLTGVWSPCPSMTNPRGNCCVTVVQNCLYALGGYDGNTVERFDPRTSKWMTVTRLNSLQTGFAVAALDDALYCVGGWKDNVGFLSTGVRFDVRRNAWEPIADMERCRYYHCVVALDGALMAIGGSENFFSKSSLSSTETYDPRTDTWTATSTPPMRTPRHYLGATVLYSYDTIDSKLSTTCTRNTAQPS